MVAQSRVLVIGGTGFIGYHITRVLLDKEYGVTIMSRTAQKTEISESKLTFIAGDIETISVKELKQILDSIDAVVFAAGVDDRTIAHKPAFDFFYHKNVEPIIKLGEALKETGVKNLIILGSYFSWLNRTRPELQLYETHPYVKSRAEQVKEALDFANEKLNVVVLELPYVFGVYPNKKPMWTPLIKYCNTVLPFLFYTNGGSAAISVRQVAEAVEKILRNSVPSGAYPIADANLTWDELLVHFRNGNRTRIIHLKKWFLFPFAKLVEFTFRIFNREPGIKLSAFLTVQCKNTFVPPEDLMPDIKPNHLQLLEDIKLTVKASLQLT